MIDLRVGLFSVVIVVAEQVGSWCSWKKPDRSGQNVSSSKVAAESCQCSSVYARAGYEYAIRVILGGRRYRKP